MLQLQWQTMADVPVVSMGPDNVTVYVLTNCLCYFIILGLKRVMFPSLGTTVKTG